MAKKLAKKTSATKSRARNADHPPSWLPDWHDVAAYPGNNASLMTWAWEFLRRNSEYKKDWLALMGKFPRWDFGKGYPKEFFNEGGEGIAVKYGLAFPTDPARAEAIPIFKKPMLSVLAGPSSFPLPDDEIAVTIKLALPLKRQLRMIESWCRGARQARSIKHVRYRDRSDLYRDYLRCLDADACGEERADIARTIFPHLSNEHPDYHGSRQVRDSLVAAKLLRDSDYRYLPTLK